jgi:hypothetical protein
LADAVRRSLHSMKLMECVDSKGDPLILEQTVRRHKQHKLKNATDSLKTQDRIKDRNKTKRTS